MNTKSITKKDQRTNSLNRHYAALATIAVICGVSNPDGKKLSLKLWKLEQAASKLSLDYCNGDNGITSENWDEKILPIEESVQELFNNNLNGFFVNGDCRGYALKIKTELFNTLYRESGLQTDWGGFGLLSPQFD